MLFVRLAEFPAVFCFDQYQWGTFLYSDVFYFFFTQNQVPRIVIRLGCMNYHIKKDPSLKKKLFFFENVVGKFCAICTATGYSRFLFWKFPIYFYQFWLSFYLNPAGNKHGLPNCMNHVNKNIGGISQSDLPFSCFK